MKEYYARVPLNRIGNNEEIVNPILFLLLNTAFYITGTTLQVETGISRY